MEFIIISIFFSFSALLLLFFFFFKMNINKSTKPIKLPPGPNPLPIIGNIHNLYGPLPHHILTDLSKQYGPLMHLKLGEVCTVIVSSPDVAKSVMNDHDVVFCSRPANLLCAKILNYNCLDIAFAPYGDYWRQLRKICTVELLSSKRVQTFRRVREKEVMDMIKLVSENKGSVLNLSKIIYPLSYSITALAAFSKRSKYQEEFVSAMDEAIKLMAGFNLCDMYPSFKLLEVISGTKRKLEKTHDIIDGILKNIIEEHKLMTNRSAVDDDDEDEEMKEDLVDVLLKIQENGDLGVLSDDSVKAVIYDIFSAGGETSSTTIEWTMSELIKNPRILKRAQEEVRKVFNGEGNVNESGLEELKYLKAVIKESMRLHPAAPLLLPRECTEHCKINGYDVPAKSRVLVNAWAIGRDPTHWTDPEKFDPERFLIEELTDFRGRDFGFIPFGAGRRMCPGISFAVPVLELSIAQLLYHFDWELPGGLDLEELDMSESFGLTVRRKFDLCLIPIPYEHSSIK